MERLKALLAVAFFIAAVLFAEPGRNIGRVDLTHRNDKTGTAVINDTTTNPTYNHQPEQPPEMQ